MYYAYYQICRHGTQMIRIWWQWTNHNQIWGSQVYECYNYTCLRCENVHSSR